MNDILKKLSIVIVNNTIRRLNNNFDNKINLYNPKFYNSRTLIKDCFNILIVNQFDGIDLKDVFHNNKCNIYTTKCKLIDSNKICIKIEKHISVRLGYYYYNEKVLKEKYYSTNTIFSNWINTHNIKEYSSALNEYATKCYGNLRDLKGLINEIYQLLKSEITLDKILTPYYYSMVHHSYDSELYSVFHEVVEHYLKDSNINNSNDFMTCLKTTPEKVENEFKANYRYLLDDLLDEINMDLFGYDANTKIFNKNNWVSFDKSKSKKDTFTSCNLITIKKISTYIPFILEKNIRDCTTIKRMYQFDIGSGIKYYPKTKYRDITKSRIIKRQLYVLESIKNYSNYTSEFICTYDIRTIKKYIREVTHICGYEITGKNTDDLIIFVDDSLCLTYKTPTIFMKLFD